MLRLSNIKKYFGEQLLFEKVNFEISPTEKVGVVGPNGCGKSTLLKLICGLEDSEEGSIAVSDQSHIAYLPQEQNTPPMQVGEFLAPKFFAAKQKLEALQLSAQNAAAEINWCQSDYSAAYDDFELTGGYEIENKLLDALTKLQLSSIDLTRQTDSLSGGEITKLALMRVVIQNPSLILMDEPTNNLDKPGLEWLEKLVCESKASALIVSHDRAFLDKVCSRIIEIDPINSKVTSYAGNYSWYKMRKAQDEERQLRQFKEQQTRIQLLTEDIRNVKNQALATEKATQNDYLRGRSKKVAAKAKAREARLTKIIEKEKVEKPKIVQRPKMVMAGAEQYSSNLISFEAVAYENSTRCILSELNFVIQGSKRIALEGINGSGKSTLLKLINGIYEPTLGRISIKANLRIGHLSQETSNLEPLKNFSMLDCFKTLHGTLTSTDAAAKQAISDGDIRTLLHRFQFSRNDVFKTVASLSRGEQSKLIMASFIAAELDLLLLDEPTNHLDLETIECFESALQNFRSALLVISHDRYFLERLEPTNYWSIEDGRLHQH